jgi:hypothetical protein
MPQIWGGMDWHPHTEEQHAGTRRRLVRHATRLLAERAAVLAGHHITIRFTATTAWAECSCTWTSLNWPYSEYARSDGHEHLAELGCLIVGYELLIAGRQ